MAQQGSGDVGKRPGLEPGLESTEGSMSDCPRRLCVIGEVADEGLVLMEGSTAKVRVGLWMSKSRCLISWYYSLTVKREGVGERRQKVKKNMI